MPRIPISEAEDLRADHAATFCASCTATAEEGSKYCHYCRTYWDDVDDGMFDEPHWVDRVFTTDQEGGK